MHRIDFFSLYPRSCLDRFRDTVHILQLFPFVISSLLSSTPSSIFQKHLPRNSISSQPSCLRTSSASVITLSLYLFFLCVPLLGFVFRLSVRLDTLLIIAVVENHKPSYLTFITDSVMEQREKKKDIDQKQRNESVKE